MKLLKFKIGDVSENFRSLHAGFEIYFHSLNDTVSMEEFRPFCFAGLNGSGKSNVLEALSAIFYHLEICVAQYLPKSIKDPENFKRNECSPDAFKLEYIIGQIDGSDYILENFHKVIITKQLMEEPKMEIQEFPFDDSKKKIEIELNPIAGSELGSAPGKAYLPDHVIGYSSGENEILSLPFIKSRLVHLDEFKQATEVGQRGFTESENSLIFIDNNMSQAVLLACLLFESEKTLESIKDVDNTGILDLKSFRMNINLLHFNFQKDTDENILKIINHNQIDKLKKCATSWYSNGKILWLDFYVTTETKKAFKHHFNDNSFELFQLFRLLYELNSHFVNDQIKEDVYQSKGYYTDGKLPVGSPGQNVFYFLDYYITKKIKETGEIKDLLLRNFSDGEHQFLHTIGICLLLKDRRVLLLLDEPETHFNPSWRAKFIKILNQSITSGNNRNHINGHFNVHLMKDILLTSHSPFIISDCMPDNELFFDRNEDTKNVQVRKASELGLNTYGTSVELILDRLFDYDQSIGDLSNDVLKNIDFESIDSKEKLDEVKLKLSRLGESIEKDMVLARLHRKNLQDNA